MNVMNYRILMFCLKTGDKIHVAMSTCNLNIHMCNLVADIHCVLSFGTVDGDKLKEPFI